MTQTQYQDLIQDCLAKNGIVTAKYLEQKASLNNQQGGQFLADFAQFQSAYPSLGTLVLRKEQNLDADGISHCKFSLSLLNSLDNSELGSQCSVYALVNDLTQDYKVLLSNLNSLAHQEIRAVEVSNNTPKVRHSASFEKNNQVKQGGANASIKKANNQNAAPVKKSPTEKKSVPDATLKKKKSKMVLSDDDNDEVDSKQQNYALMQSAASFSSEELDNIFDFDAKSSANSQQFVSSSVPVKNQDKDGELTVSNLELDENAEDHQDRKPSAVQPNLDTVVVINAKRKKAITKKNTFVNDQGKIVTETTTEFITDDDNDRDGVDERRDGNSGASNRVTKKAKTESVAAEKNSGVKRTGAASKPAPKSSGAKQSKLSFFAAKPRKNQS